MDMDDMRKKFYEELSSTLSAKRVDNNSFMSGDEYADRVKQVKRAKLVLRTAGTKKTTREYRLVRKYDVITVDGRERLVRPDKTGGRPVLYITSEELFDAIHSVHSATGHGGRNKTCVQLKSKYYNVTSETVMLYLRLCDQCRNRWDGRKVPGSLSAAPGPAAYNRRGRIHLVDMDPSRDFRSVLKHSDCSTGFTVLRPLKTGRPVEIAEQLIDVYTTLGPPAVLQSDRDKDFVNELIIELNTMWPELKNIRGEPTKDEGRADREPSEEDDVRVMLDDWMEKHNTRDWPTGLKFIQFRLNQSVRSDTGKSAYEATFGMSPLVRSSYSDDYNSSNPSPGHDTPSSELPLSVELKKEEPLDIVKEEIPECGDADGFCEGCSMTLEENTAGAYCSDCRESDKIQIEASDECQNARPSKKIKLSDEKTLSGN